MVVVICKVASKLVSCAPPPPPMDVDLVTSYRYTPTLAIVRQGKANIVTVSLGKHTSLSSYPPQQPGHQGWNYIIWKTKKKKEQKGIWRPICGSDVSLQPR